MSDQSTYYTGSADSGATRKADTEDGGYGKFQKFRDPALTDSPYKKESRLFLGLN